MWRPALTAYELLEQRGFEVVLVVSRHFGAKTRMK
jgi:hypothetical protein